jgi:rod shape determining protein RodA
LRSRNTDNFFANVDWLTVVLYFAMVIMGWLNIYSADYNEDNPGIFNFNEKYGAQLKWIGWATLIAVVLLIIEADFYAAFAYHIYGLFILILIATLVIGTAVHGSKSWIDLGFIRLQPAEFAKFATALAMAKFLSNVEFNVRDFKNTAVTVALFSIPALLVLLENETGLALVFFAFVIVVYREGLSLWFLVVGAFAITLFICSLLLDEYKWVLVAVLALSGFGVFFFFLRRNVKNFMMMIVVTSFCCLVATSTKYVYDHAEDWGLIQHHHKERLDDVFGFKVDLKKSGYNVHQSMIAIGSGGMWGKGYLNGTQTKYHFVPEQETDFIFCTIGEEFGFFGSALILLMQLGLNIRVLFMAERQRSPFSRIYGYCVAAVLFFHLMVNVGMTIGMTPVVGIPLPFFSYGGSSLLAFTTLLFIFIKLDANRLSILR